MGGGGGMLYDTQTRDYTGIFGRKSVLVTATAFFRLRSRSVEDFQSRHGDSGWLSVLRCPRNPET